MGNSRVPERLKEKEIHVVSPLARESYLVVSRRGSCGEIRRRAQERGSQEFPGGVPSQQQENRIERRFDPVYESSSLRAKRGHKKLKARTAVVSGWKLLEPMEPDPEGMMISGDG